MKTSGLDRLNEARRRLYRLAKYHLTAPEVPDFSAVLGGRKVVIAGSAPVSHRPAGYDGSYRIVTINASQRAIGHWLDRDPDLTLMMFNQIEGHNPTALEVRRVLQGHRTRLLCMLLWRHDIARLREGLARFDYGYDELRVMSRYQRMALMRRATGLLNPEMETDAKWSNGIVATALALVAGAERVILTGINPLSQGHGYNALGLTRHHMQTDLQALQLFQRQGRPVYTADPEVAEGCGLPLWRGE